MRLLQYAIMLHELLTAHRQELIIRCREKAALRFEPTAIPAAVDHGVPLFLQQLVDTLRVEQLTDVRDESEPEAAPAHTEIGRAAALHGAEMLRVGFSIDQVVHDYGDVCQSVTDLAVTQDVNISADEFRTLNRCLDNAIADAVASFGNARQSLLNNQAETLHIGLETFADEQRRLVDISINSFAAIKTGNVGVAGATATLLVHALNELRSLAERCLPEIRKASMPPATGPS